MATASTAYTGIISPEDPHMPGPQKAMLDATPDCVKILSVDGRVLMINRAGVLALGLSETCDMGMPWLPLLHEDVRAAGLVALEKAASGETARFPGKSISPAGMFHWDNLLIPVKGPAGHVLSIMCVSRDVTEKILIERQLEEAISREKLLAREMQHRIKNLFSVASGLVVIAEKEARLANAPDTLATLLREKLNALARASDAVFAHRDEEHGVGSTDLEALVRSVLKPYGDHCIPIGEPVRVHTEVATTLALFLHELATNAMKYGALTMSGGTVTLRWSAKEGVLTLAWIESGGPRIVAPPTRSGFGSQMLDRIVRSSGGRIDRDWRTDGLVAELYLPLSEND